MPPQKSELSEPYAPCFVLSSQESAKLEETLKGCSVSPLSNLEEFIFEATSFNREFPKLLSQKILDFKINGNREGALFIKGFSQQDGLPPTPITPEEKVKNYFFSEFVLASVGSMFGDLIAYSQEKNGAIFQDVFPIKKHEAMQTNESSRVFLEFHTENCFHPFPPDYLFLYCLRGDPEKNAKTYFCSLEKILPYLSAEEIFALFQENFLTSLDYSFGAHRDKKGQYTEPMSVLFGNPQHSFFRFDCDLMIGTTREAESALKKMRHIIDLEKSFICFEAGDLLILNNKKAAHARSSFFPRYDGRDRWLQRLYVLKDSDRAAKDIVQKRIIQTDFSKYLL